MIYVAGGVNATGSLSVTERYNPQLDGWAGRSSLKVPAAPVSGRHGLAAVVPLGHSDIFAVGGEHAANVVFDSNGNWTTSGTLYVHSAVEKYTLAPAVLQSSLSVSPNPAGIGEIVSVVLSVTNAGDVALNALKLDIGINSGAGGVGPLCGPITIPTGGPVPVGEVATARGYPTEPGLAPAPPRPHPSHHHR